MSVLETPMVRTRKAQPQKSVESRPKKEQKLKKVSGSTKVFNLNKQQKTIQKKTIKTRKSVRKTKK